MAETGTKRVNCEILFGSLVTAIRSITGHTSTVTTRYCNIFWCFVPNILSIVERALSPMSIHGWHYAERVSGEIQ